MNYELNGAVATLTFDDGKANAIGMQFMAEINEGLDRAESEAKAVVITGRPGLLSGGFDLKVIQEGGEAVREMMRQATDMYYRLYSHPQPLVIASPGHAVAAGAFSMLRDTLGSFGPLEESRVSLPDSDLHPLVAYEEGRVSFFDSAATRAWRPIAGKRGLRILSVTPSHAPDPDVEIRECAS